MGELRGIKRIKVERAPAREGEPADRHHIVYYCFNLAELTYGSLRGEAHEDWIDKERGIARTREFWTWDLLAKWVLCLEFSARPLDPAELDAFRQSFRDEPLNAPNLHVLDNPASVPSWIPTASDDPDAEPIATREPTILLLPEVPWSNFQFWYRRRVLYGEASRFPRKELTYFEDFRSTYIDPVVAANRKLESRVTQPYAKLLAQLQLGERLYAAIFAFANPDPSSASWRGRGLAFVVPLPGEDRQRDVRQDQENWSRLTHQFATLAGKQFTDGKEARARDAAARSLLARLRDPAEPLVEMLARPELLAPDEHLKLRTLLADSMTALVRSPWACDQLLKGEFAAVAHAASKAPAPVPFEPKTARERSLAAAITSFDSRDVLPIEAESGLNESILGFFTGAKTAMGQTKEALVHLGIGLDLLGLATPFIHRAMFVPKTGVVNEAWLWRSLVGVTKMSVDWQRDLWRELSIQLELARFGLSDPSRVVGVALLDVDRGPLAKALDGLTSNVVWKTARLLVTVLAASAAVDELSEKTLEDALTGMSAMLSTMKAAADLVTLDPEKCLLLSTYANDAPSLATIAAAADTTKALELLGPMADALAFAASAVEFRNSATKQSWRTREQKTEALLLDGLTLVVSAIGLAAGSQLALASLAIYVAQTALLDRDVWDFVVPGLVRAPGPQRFLRKILHTLDDDAFVLRMRELPNRFKDPAALSQFQTTLQALLDSLDAPVEDGGAQRYWDIGGAPGAHLDYAAKGILREVYGFEADARAEIVLPSTEVS